MSTTTTSTLAHPTTTPFQPIHYVPTSRKAVILSQRIHTILLIAHAQFTPPPPLSNSNPSPPTNHWSIYLLPPPISSPSSSFPSPSASSGPQPFIHIDCQPSHTTPSTVLPGGSKANVVVSLLYNSAKTDTDDTVTGAVTGAVTGTKTEIAIPDAVHRVPLPVTHDALTAGDLMDLLVTAGREKYEFDERGVGCRCWVLGLVELLDRNRIVGGEDWDRAWDAVGRLWPGGGASAMDRGAYY